MHTLARDGCRHAAKREGFSHAPERGGFSHTPEREGFSRALIGALILLVAAVVARAGAADEELPRTTKLADGVFAYEHVDPTKRGVTVNNLVVITSDGVLVADGQGTVENTKALLAQIATLTPQPVRYVLVGSVHGDHRGGDAAFPPGVTFIKEPKTLTLGGRTIDVIFLGRSHTGSDLEVHLPREKILYMSEVFSTRIFPSMANSNPSEWLTALSKADALAADQYIPAHGAMDAPRPWTRDELRLYRQALERVVTEGQRLHDAKVPVDDAAAKADFGPYASWTRAKENAPSAMKRIYMERDGQLKEEVRR